MSDVAVTKIGVGSTELRLRKCACGLFGSELEVQWARQRQTQIVCPQCDSRALVPEFCNFEAAIERWQRGEVYSATHYRGLIRHEIFKLRSTATYWWDNSSILDLLPGGELWEILQNQFGAGWVYAMADFANNEVKIGGTGRPPEHRWSEHPRGLVPILALPVLHWRNAEEAAHDEIQESHERAGREEFFSCSIVEATNVLNTVAALYNGGSYLLQRIASKEDGRSPMRRFLSHGPMNLTQEKLDAWLENGGVTA